VKLHTVVVAVVVTVVVVTVVVVVVLVVVVAGVGTQSGSEQKSLVVKIPSSFTPVAHQPFPSVVTEGTHLS
jgi:hypothetical protein